MSVLRLWTFASILACCIGFTIVQRPAEYYNYRRHRNDYQWQPLDYQWKQLQYQSQPYDYQPSYSSYYSYYYPIYEFSDFYGYDKKPSLPFAEGQHLLQVYRIIRVIVVFRQPTKIETSLDRLIRALTDDALQEKLVQLLHHVDGYREVAELTNDPSVDESGSFVNHYRRLLPAIQRALNALDLTTEFDNDLCDKLRALRDQANALTVEQIERELQQGSKGLAKEALVSDVLENLLGEVDSTDLDEFNENYEVVVEGDEDDEPLDLDKVEKYLVVIDEPESVQESKDRNELDEEALEDLAAALELYLEEQKLPEANVVKEKSTDADFTTEGSSTSSTATYTTTYAPWVPTPNEPTKDTWLGSLFGKGNLLAGHHGTENSANSDHVIDVSQPAVLIEPDSQNTWIHEETQDKDSLVFDIDQRFQTVPVASGELSTTHSVPLWLIENSKNQQVESKQIEQEDLIAVPTKDQDELQQQIPEGEDDLMVESREMENLDTAEAQTEENKELLRGLPEPKQPNITAVDDIAEGEAQKISVDDEALQKVNEEGPARFDLPVDLSDRQQPESAPEPTRTNDPQNLQQLDKVTTESVTSVPGDVQLTTLNGYEVHTESTPIESREESIVVSTATSEPDARRFVREEVLKVLNLLEESDGFIELKDHITEQDVDELVDELSRVQAGIRWTEMISALQRLIASKPLHNGDRIVEGLNHWKAGEEATLDDGYFARTYGALENRQLLEGIILDEIQREFDESKVEKMKPTQLAATIMESRGLEEEDHTEAVTKRVMFIDDQDNYFEGTYALNNNTGNQTLPLNGSESHNATFRQSRNETTTEAVSSTTEIPLESRNPRIINVDDELEHSTQGSTTGEAPVPLSLRAEEVTETLEVTTPQPFPAHQT